MVFFIRGRGFKINQQNVERKEKTVRCGGLKKAYRSLVTVYYCSPCKFLVSVCQFTKKEGLFLELSGPELIWGRDRPALNLTPFDSSARTRTTHIKSAC